MGKYLIKEAKTGYVFNLMAANGQTIGVSEVYSSKAACLGGVESVRKTAEDAALEDQTGDQTAQAKCPKFEIYLDRAGEYRFRLKARNGETILASEGYKRKESCLGGVESVRRNAGSPTEEE